MNSALYRLVLGQSLLHLVSYGLVAWILFVAISDAFLIAQLRRLLRRQAEGLGRWSDGASRLTAMIHPVATALNKCGAATGRSDEGAFRRNIELAEATLFVPLRARMTLTRDLSTLMGLIATLLALVAAATEFARNGKPELLVGSVGTGCVATCVAAVGCAIALWNLSRLSRLRLDVACQSEELLTQIEGAEIRNGSVQVDTARTCLGELSP